MKIITTLKKVLNSNTLFIIFFSFLGLLSLGIAISSLKWTYGLDNQHLLYYAFLMDNFHYLPYRDFFEFQFPAVDLYYLVIAKTFGYSYTGFRAADLIYLSVFLTLSFLLFKKISWKVASCSVIIFSLVYFKGTNSFSFERDYVLILPIILAILFMFSYPGKILNLKSFVIGFCSSISALIKPHSIIVFPLLFVFQMWKSTESGSKIFSLRRLVKPLFYSILGLLLPILIMILYLWSTNSLKSFWDIQSNFILLYTKSKIGIVSDPSQPPDNMFSFNNLIKLGGYSAFILPATIGFYVSIFRSNLNKSQRLLVYLMGSLSILFIVYVLIAGKFFTYHWIPFAYCAVFLSSLYFVDRDKIFQKFEWLFDLLPLFIIICIITISIFKSQQPLFIFNELKGMNKGDPRYSDVVQTANFLKSELKPCEKVISLDEVGYGLHSMLLARAEQGIYYAYEDAFAFLETEFPNSEYLNNIHKDYINRFNNAKPRYVIVFPETTIFEDLQTILNSEYTAIRINNTVIYKRNNE